MTTCNPTSNKSMPTSRAFDAGALYPTKSITIPPCKYPLVASVPSGGESKMWMRSGKRLVRRIITNEGCGDDGGKGGKGGGNGRLGVRRMRWKIERRRREKKDMLIVISLPSARRCRLWRSSQFSSYIYLYICIHLVYMHSAGGGIGGKREIRRMPYTYSM